MESLAYTAFKQVGPPQLQNFYEFYVGILIFFQKTFYLATMTHIRIRKILLEKTI